MSADPRRTLRLFLWARAQHRLYLTGKPCNFSEAASLIAQGAGLAPATARAVLAGGFSSAGTKEKAARWCGLKRAAKHGQPVLVPDLSLPLTDDQPDGLSSAEGLASARARGRACGSFTAGPGAVRDGGNAAGSGARGAVPISPEEALRRVETRPDRMTDALMGRKGAA